MRGSGIRSGRFSYSPNAPEERPTVTLRLVKRVIDYALPYRWLLVAMLTITMVTTGLSLLTPLILRDLIDRTLPTRDLQRLVWLSVGLVAIPLLSGGLNVVLRQVNARVGEGVVLICGQRCFLIYNECPSAFSLTPKWVNL